MQGSVTCHRVLPGPRWSPLSPLVPGGSPALAFAHESSRGFSASFFFALENWVPGPRKGGGRLAYS